MRHIWTISNIQKNPFWYLFVIFLTLYPKITSLDPLPLITEYIVHSVVYHWTTPPPLYNVQYYSPQECTHACIWQLSCPLQSTGTWQVWYPPLLYYQGTYRLSYRMVYCVTTHHPQYTSVLALLSVHTHHHTYLALWTPPCYHQRSLWTHAQGGWEGCRWLVHILVLPLTRYLPWYTRYCWTCWGGGSQGGRRRRQSQGRSC